MSNIQFCPQCGGKTNQLIPDGDNRPRAVCSDCGTIHYENPKNIVGCLLTWRGRVLLCKRAIEPRYGLWTLPAGFMENQETAMAGAAREAYEEAYAECADLELFAVYSLPRISQVYTMFIGELTNGEARAGDESLDVGLYTEQEIPWKELAFPVVTETLQRYFERRHERTTDVLYADIINRPGQPLEIVRYPVG